MARLQQSDIVGQRIAELRVMYSSTGEDGWLDTADCWVVLESGVTFRLPLSDSNTVETEKPSLTASPISGRDWPEVVGHQVQALHRYMFAGEPSSGEFTLLELDGGTLLSCTLMAPHGTGAVGFCITRLEELGPDESLAPFW